eukprot:TRINITY_DN21526_c0_g1_i1.p1 TRINITY_DN21526_c0_g1~~TRINITY_DN21526_c0_g1_i1.p1  ORF type:complete len:844 (+),score=179.55 TRINITY_DN21526_c0_g1_i1:121-2652(+)
MHTLPDKLTSLRHTLEASFQRKLVELELRVRNEITTAVVKAEESAVERSQKAFFPDLEALSTRISEEIEPVRRQVEVVASETSSMPGALKKAFDDRASDLTEQIVSAQAEFPSIHHRLKENAAAVSVLQGVRPAFTEMIAKVNENFVARIEVLQDSIAREAERASAAERDCARSVRELEEAQTASFRDADSRDQKRIATAMDHVSSVENLVLHHVREMTKQLAEAEERLTAAREQGQSQIHASLQEISARVEDHQSHWNSRTATMERRLCVSLEEAAMRAEVNAGKEAAVLVNDLRDTIALKVSDVISIARTERASSDAIHEQAAISLHQRLDEVVLNLKSEDEALSKAVNAAESRVNASVLQVSQAAEANVQVKIAEAIAQLRDEVDASRSTVLDRQEMLAKELRRELGCFVDSCKEHANAVGERSQQLGAASVEILGKQVRTEACDLVTEAHSRMDTERAYILDKLSAEVKACCRSADDMHAKHVKHVHEIRVELQAKIASCSADLHARLDGFVTRHEETKEQARETTEFIKRLRTDIEEVDQAWRKELSDVTEVLVTADRAAKAFSESVRDRAGENLQTEVAALQARIAADRAHLDEDVMGIHVQMKEFALRREVADAAAASARVTAEISKRLCTAESIQVRHRERVELVTHDLEQKVTAALSETSDAKALMKQETSTLGSELSGIRAATTSLTHGVLKALQVIGLFHSEVDVVPRRNHCGRLPVVQHRWGVEVGDLLEWEKAGQSLANRVMEHWGMFEAMGAPSVLAFMERKANEKDLRPVQATLRLIGSQNLPAPGRSPSLERSIDMSPQAPTTPRVGPGTPHLPPRRFRASPEGGMG